MDHAGAPRAPGGRRRRSNRNTVERGFSRLKQWRGIATRYDLAYLGGVTLAAIVIHHRVRN